MVVVDIEGEKGTSCEYESTRERKGKENTLDFM